MFVAVNVNVGIHSQAVYRVGACWCHNVLRGLWVISAAIFYLLGILVPHSRTPPASSGFSLTCHLQPPPVGYRRGSRVGFPCLSIGSAEIGPFPL